MRPVTEQTSAERHEPTEASAIALIEKYKGKYTRDEKRSGRPVVTGELIDHRVTDEAVAELVGLSELTSLNLAAETSPTRR